MKKIYLSLIAVAAIFTACEKNEVLVDAQSEAAPKAIAFESFSQAATRATENNTADYTWAFFNHHETFEVYGYKNTSADPVFNDDVVTVTSDGAATPKYTYTYSPLRYWDKAATSYQYYAAAPSADDWTFNGVTSVDTQDEGYFTTSSTLTGTNLSSATVQEYVESFKDASGDVDKLIAAPKTVYKAYFSETVQLNFIHILSRLNVTVKKAEILKDQTVTIKKLEVHNLLKTGAFDEHNAAAATAGNHSRWTASGDAVTYAAPTDQVVTATATTANPNPDPQYLIQSLVIPQDAAFESVALDGKAKTAAAAVLFTLDEYNAYFGTSLDATSFAALSAAEKTKIPAVVAANEITATSKPYLVITYTIKDPANATATAEEFTAYYNLANAFGLTTGNLAFNEGWQNTLHITLNPDLIQFCAQVSAWSSLEHELEVE